MALEMWDCPCGRRVPGHVETCRCGRARTAVPASAPPFVPPAALEPTSLHQTTGLRAVGVLVAMVAVYFGSRACNREVASRDVRAQAEQELTRSLGAANAETALNRYHRECFGLTYSTGWGRRQGSKFDDQKYVACLVDRVRKDQQFASGASSGRPRRSSYEPLPTRVPGAGPPRLGFRRFVRSDPKTKVHELELSVSGGALPAMIFTNQQVICDGVPIWKQPAHPTISFGYNDDPSLALVGILAKAGAQSCVFEIALADPKMQPISETLRVPLPQ